MSSTEINADKEPYIAGAQAMEEQPPLEVVPVDQQQSPVDLEVHGSRTTQTPHTRYKRTRVFQNEVKNLQLKEFGVILVTKSSDIINDIYSYRTTTFNAPIVKEWTCKGQMPQYLSVLYNGPNNNNRIVNKVTSVQIISNTDQISVSDESGAASLGWVDKNADVSINVTSHIW